MPQTDTVVLAALLTQAGNAHHTYEQTVLKGKYDEDWSVWYADYVIQHGLGNIINQPVTTEQLSQFLSESYQVYQQENPTQNWEDYTAEKMVRELTRTLQA
jgi:hypothetical protein